MTISHITPLYVETIPASLEDGLIYISKNYQTAVHRCCCGCGNRVVTPLKPGGWNLVDKRGAVSLYPSDKLVERIAEADAKSDPSTYYERFLVAFERLALEKGLVNSEELDQRTEEYASGERDDFEHEHRHEGH